MITKLEEVARPYARAAFEFANQQQQIPHWMSMLQVLTSICNDPKIGQALRSPALDEPAKVALILDIAGDIIDESCKNLVRVIAENKRLRAIPEICRQFHGLQEAAVNIVEAEVTTARPLNDALMQQLVAALESRTKAKVELHHHVDPALLGGLRIRIGDEVIDNSIQGKLQRLAHHLQLKENVCQ